MLADSTLCVRDLFWRETVVLLLGSFFPSFGDGWVSPPGSVCSSLLGWFGFFLSLANLLKVNIIYIKHIAIILLLISLFQWQAPVIAVVHTYLAVAVIWCITILLDASVDWHHTIDWYYWVLIIIVIAWHSYSFILIHIHFINPHIGCSNYWYTC